LSRIIEVTISPNGQTKVETKGFQGADCQAASQFIELALGTRGSERLTPEFHQVTPAQVSSSQRQ
jgi:hypothetical protein